MLRDRKGLSDSAGSCVWKSVAECCQAQDVRVSNGVHEQVAAAAADSYTQPSFMRVLWASACLLATGCAALAPSPPRDQSNICEIFREQPEWYDYARRSQDKWGTSIATQMAFIQHESAFRSHVRPPRDRLLGFIPWSRPSSAHGYAQAQDPVWGEYRDDAGSAFARRTHMKYATDFVGWYNRRTHEQLGIPLDNPEHLYLAYHEGPTGYRRGGWRSKSQVKRAASQVSARARRYQSQLAACESEFRCRRFYQVWPFCRE